MNRPVRMEQAGFEALYDDLIAGVPISLSAVRGHVNLNFSNYSVNEIKPKFESKCRG